jgi:FkbM family methyltransferase
MIHRLLRTLRLRFHPLDRARRVSVVRRALAKVDRPIWIRLDGVDWPVRVRAVRHASYRFRSTRPEPEIAALALAVVEVAHASRFGDVGGNFGYYTWLLKSRFPDLAVEIIEPESNNLELIDATLARTPLANVTVHRGAASDVSGRGLFQRDLVSGATGALAPDPASVSSRTQSSSAEEVPTFTLDSLLSEGVDLLKIDVEGHEQRVLRGAGRLLEQREPVVIFECFGGPEAAVGMFDTSGFEFFDAERFTRPSASTTNFLAIPSRLQGRISELHAAWLRNLDA